MVLVCASPKQAISVNRSPTPTQRSRTKRLFLAAAQRTASPNSAESAAGDFQQINLGQHLALLGKRIYLGKSYAGNRLSIECSEHDRVGLIIRLIAGRSDELLCLNARPHNEGPARYRHEPGCAIHKARRRTRVGGKRLLANLVRRDRSRDAIFHLSRNDLYDGARKVLDKVQ